MVSPLLHHLSHQRQSKTVCGTLTHPDPEPRRRKINFDPSDIHKLKPCVHAQREDPPAHNHPSSLCLGCVWLCALCSGSLTRRLNLQECQYIKLSLSNALRSYVNLSHLITSKSKRFSVIVHHTQIPEICCFHFLFLPHLSFFICLGSWRQACV